MGKGVGFVSKFLRVNCSESYERCLEDELSLLDYSRETR